MPQPLVWQGSYEELCRTWGNHGADTSERREEIGDHPLACQTLSGHLCNPFGVETVFSAFLSQGGACPVGTALTLGYVVEPPLG
jgi:hypothetical protein